MGWPVSGDVDDLAAAARGERGQERIDGVGGQSGRESWIGGVWPLAFGRTDEDIEAMVANDVRGFGQAHGVEPIRRVDRSPAGVLLEVREQSARPVQQRIRVRVQAVER